MIVTDIASDKPRIAFVGAGPTAIYTFHAFVSRATAPCVVTFFEEQPVAGRGTPYRPGWNDPAMLSNIASVEIPPLEETLIGWLERQSPARLAALGLDSDAIDERAFYPRVVLGAFFKDQFDALVERAHREGHEVHIRTRCRVLDAARGEKAISLSLRSPRGAETQTFEHLVIATGHQWPEDPEASPGYFLSPWPASRLAEIAPCRVGIRGSSLTAIDATVALAAHHGTFVERGDRLAYEPAPNTGAFHVTMMSRKGLLPEADFYHPLPYEPLQHCTAEAIDELVAGSPEGLLDKVFELFRRELMAVDPGYARERSLESLTVETFAESYFDRRSDIDPFVWAERNLREAETNYARRHTVPWRYAILRMHEVIAPIVPHLDDDDFERFTKSFKSVFVDDYATVPHESIKRLLALHEVQKLDLLALGERYRLDSRCREGGAVVHVGGERLHFPVFIEATGQRSLSAADFPFPSLVAQGIVRDEPTASSDVPGRGIVVDDRFHPIVDGEAVDQLFCLSLPFLLGRHPFIQGITSSHEMGSAVGAALADAALSGTVGRSGTQSPAARQ
jgi:uncharacterized NAD(P)/FAD-binding protein YdhS